MRISDRMKREKNPRSLTTADGKISTDNYTNKENTQVTIEIKYPYLKIIAAKQLQGVKNSEEDDYKKEYVMTVWLGKERKNAWSSK
ncbi:hypothetical protein SESBI_49365 [Sesbania bispinosa]|nr:hypothetical protein SESBI_49365 [Sesbania bispinosa]